MFSETKVTEIGQFQGFFFRMFQLFCLIVSRLLFVAPFFFSTVLPFSFFLSQGKTHTSQLE